jgi:nuclear pore complex protein Nup107
LDSKWRELGGFWEEESQVLGGDEDEVRPSGGLEEVFGEMAGVQNDNVA